MRRTLHPPHATPATPASASTRRGRRRAALALPLALLGCAARLAAGAGDERAPAPPLSFEGTAYELAGKAELPEAKAEELPGLHNVHRLSANIVSGAEPEGEEAFRELQKMGVRTILSVDGKIPDADTAAKYGLRYVHVPIQYKGITPEEVLAIAKTFREQQGPFYVHCFHGKHRGPAAAAVGRVVLDGTERQQAIGEMRQWCGTSSDYEGLYATIARQWMPDASATAAFPFSFPEAHELEGVRGVMIPVPRAHDALKAMAKHGWAVDPSHPDADPVHEADILHRLMMTLEKQPEARAMPSDFQGWIADALGASAALHEALAEGRRGLSPTQPLEGEARERADAALSALGNSCKACHGVYRD